MKKASSLKSAKKSMASFMTTRLSSARCEGRLGNLPPPILKVKTRKKARGSGLGSAGLGELLAKWRHLLVVSWVSSHRSHVPELLVGIWESLEAAGGHPGRSNRARDQLTDHHHLQIPGYGRQETGRSATEKPAPTPFSIRGRDPTDVWN